MRSPAETEIRAARQASNDAIRRGDLDAVAATLDADFNVIVGNGEFLPTRQKYIGAFKRVFDDPKGDLFERIPETVEVSTTDPLAAEHGHWTATRPDGAVSCGGAYFAVWRHTRTGWKLRSETFVTLR